MTIPNMLFIRVVLPQPFGPIRAGQTQDYGFDDFHNLDSDQLIKTMYGALKKMCSDTYGQ
jgi:hypothetical protein